MKDIEGFEGRYAITDNGQFWSHPKGSSNKHGRFIKLVPATNGYLFARPLENGKRYSFLAHRLVALAFVPNKDGLPFVNHIDGNKTNNHYTNLEWCTRSQNMRHAYKKGLCTTTKVLTPNQALKARELHDAGWTIGQLSDIYCVGTTTIQRAVAGNGY